MQRTFLFITSRLPWPASTGRKASLFHYCKMLHEKFGFRVVVASFLETDERVENKPDFIDNIYVLRQPSTFEKGINLLRDTFITGRRPMQVSLYWSRRAAEQINEIVLCEKPDVVMADMIRTTEFCRGLDILKIADFDDMLSVRYYRQLDFASEYVNPYGAYLARFGAFGKKILMSNLVKQFVMRRESKMVERYELEIARDYDCSIFVAQQEADVLNSRLGFENAFAVPIGVDYDFLSEPVLPDLHFEDCIVFLGAMTATHNIQGCAYFIKDVLPLIEKDLPGIRFVVVGANPPSALMQLARENVEFVGWVDDVRPIAKAAKVFVCPLQFGSGIKTKNLEAMAMSVPVVTTGVGAENIDAVDGQDWLLADSAEKFAKQVIRLVCDEDFAKAIGSNGQKFVSEKWTWSAVEQSMDKVLKKMGLDQKETFR